MILEKHLFRGEPPSPILLLMTCGDLRVVVLTLDWTDVSLSIIGGMSSLIEQTEQSVNHSSDSK